MARRVTTQAGADYFGVPIGSLITGKEDETPSREGAKPKAKKVRPLVGRALNPVAGTNPTNNSGPTVQSGSTAPTMPRTPDVQKVDPNKRYGEQGQITEQPFSFKAGNQATETDNDGSDRIEVGGTEFSLPKGSKVYDSPFGNAMKYIVTPEGSFRIATKRGELELSPVMQARMVRLMMDAFGDDRDGDEES